jgi:Leucine-rich repeat (LRR) protein
VEVFGFFEAKEVFCKEIEKTILNFDIDVIEICNVAETTVIDELNMTVVTIIDDPNMTVPTVIRLNFQPNEKINYLLVKVADSFPNLEMYNALGCSVKEISKENFAGLKKLKFLNLNFNKIERINSETFEDLVTLEELHLGKKT